MARFVLFAFSKSTPHRNATKNCLGGINQELSICKNCTAMSAELTIAKRDSFFKIQSMRLAFFLNATKKLCDVVMLSGIIKTKTAAALKVVIQCHLKTVNTFEIRHLELLLNSIARAVERTVVALYQQ